jgi:hypothetical protein
MYYDIKCEKGKRYTGIFFIRNFNVNIYRYIEIIILSQTLRGVGISVTPVTASKQAIETLRREIATR